MKVVVKIGGSLIKEAPELMDTLVKEFGSKNPKAVKEGYACEASCHSILVVPGGGIFADVVRAVNKEFPFSADSAHWMAILGMEQYACYLWDKSNAAATDSITDLPCGVSILFPYRLLKIEDPLPHTWDVTSDTIAAWVAKQTDSIFVKVTDVDGIFKDGKLIREISASSFKGCCESCIDFALPMFLLTNRMQCLIVNGKYPERVVQTIYGKPALYTAVKGNI